MLKVKYGTSLSEFEAERLHAADGEEDDLDAEEEPLLDGRAEAGEKTTTDMLKDLAMESSLLDSTVGSSKIRGEGVDLVC